MKTDSQKGGTALEQPDVEFDFIQEFKMMTEPKLRLYEQENRDRIVGASLAIRDAFDKKWLNVVGSNYFQPATAIQPAAADGATRRIDPKSLGYKGWWEVMFSPKAKPDDQNDVTLSVNGVCLQMQREEPVILPGSYLECADHGVYPTYQQLAGKQRKVAGHVKTFPYTVLRSATEAEYKSQKAAGDAATRKAIEAEDNL